MIDKFYIHTSIQNRFWEFLNNTLDGKKVKKL